MALKIAITFLCSFANALSTTTATAMTTAAQQQKQQQRNVDKKEKNSCFVFQSVWILKTFGKNPQILPF